MPGAKRNISIHVARMDGGEGGRQLRHDLAPNGFHNFIDHICSLLIDEVSRPGVNQGSLLINLDRDDVSRSGKDVYNYTRYNSINLL